MTALRSLSLVALLCVLGCSGTEEVPIFGPEPDGWDAFDPAWTVVHPANGRAWLLAACALPTEEAWAVGTGGVVLHHAGGTWRRESSGTPATLAAVAADARLSCAVGTGGTILVREAGVWRREESGVRGALRAVTIAADGAVWAGGAGGRLLRREAAGWRPVSWPDTAEVTALAAWGDTVLVGTAAAEVYGLAGDGARRLAAFGGTSVQCLAVSPSGALFAAADRVYRYDAGRWVQVVEDVCRVLGANDRYVFCGWGSLSVHGHDGSWDWDDPAMTLPRFSGSIVAACAVGAEGALVVGEYGHLAWLRSGEWERDLAGALAGTPVRLADNTVCMPIDEQLVAWQDGVWRAVQAAPPDSADAELLGGLDPDRCLYSNFRYYLWGGSTWLKVPPVQDYTFEAQAVIALDDLLIVSQGNGLWAWTGSEWRQEYRNANPDSWIGDLQQTRTGEVFALDGDDHLLRRTGDRWVEAGRLSDPPANPGSLICAGLFPAPFVLIGQTDCWLAWSALSDSTQDRWHTYDLPADDWQVDSIIETSDGIYAKTNSDRVVRRSLLGPGAGRWEVVAGPMPEDISLLRVEPDGSLTAFNSSTGRVWRHPGGHRP